MSASDDKKPLPPGKTGLPLLGETLTFIKDGFGFIEQRARKHGGGVFRTRILGRDTAVLVGPEGAGKFIDAADVQREGGMPPHIQEFFGGRALPVLDGDEHLERKRYVLAGFTREALASYVPTIQRTVARYLERWASRDAAPVVLDLKSLSIETICETIMGLPPGPAIDRLREDYAAVGVGFASLPIPLPGTGYTRAKQAVARILATYEQTIRDHLAAPKEDGLSRILAFKSPTTGQTIPVEKAAMELNHIVIAGLIVWAWLASALTELARSTVWREKLVEEVKRLAPSGPITLEQLAAMPVLRQVSMEIRRMAPVVPVFFGKAKRDFTVDGKSIPAGWMVLWGHRSSHLAPEVYAAPETFDPARFGDERAEDKKHEHAFVPNGAGPPTGHKCAGADFATYFLQLFLVELARGYRWELAPGQDLALDWALIPPEPKDGLKIQLQRGGA